MARNEQKSQLTMNRWVKAQADATKLDRGLRPYLSSECDNLSDTLFFRKQIIREVTELVRDIQNAGLGEHTLRDMNDTINKKLREKGHWERRIVELGGQNFRTNKARFEGQAVSGSGGYMYFGAVRNLPGVRELFEQPEIKKRKRTRHEMYKGIDPDYYGYRDEDDGVLVLCEMEGQEKAINEAVQSWVEEKRQKKKKKEEMDPATLLGDNKESDGSSSEGDEVPGGLGDADDDDETLLKAHVYVPNQDDIEKLILRRKKQALLNKYAADDNEKA